MARLSILQPLRARNAVVRNARLPDHPVRVVTPFGDTNASVSRLDSAPNPLIAIAKDTLSSDKRVLFVLGLVSSRMRLVRNP